MNFLQRALDTTRGLLRRPTPTAQLHKDTVVQDMFDKQIFKEVLSQVAPLQELITETNEQHSYTRELVGDVFNLFHQASPEIREVAQLDPERLINHAVTTDIALAPDTEPTRDMTMNDRYCATMATIGVGERIKERLNKEAKKQEEQQEKVKQAEEAAAEQEKKLQEALEKAEECAGDLEGEGPLTEAQTAALEALMEQGDALTEALSAQEAAIGDAQDAAGASAQALRQQIREAVTDVEAQISEELAAMRGWGVDPGELQRMSFEERAALAQKLMTGKLGKFYKQLGRFKMQASADRARKVEYARDEVIGTRLSGDLEDVLSSELVMSRHPALRLDFLQRFADGQLLSKRYQGVEKIGQGAIIVAVDSSGSMQGQCEIWSKSFAIALIEQAREANRDCVVMNFSSKGRITTYAFPKGKSDLPKLIDFVTEFHNGGTDFPTPIDEAIKIMARDFNDSGRAKADLIFVTDDDARVSAEWLDNYKAQKDHLGFRTYGIAVGMARAGSTLASLSDNVRAVSDFVSTDQVSDIFRSV